MARTSGCSTSVLPVRSANPIAGVIESVNQVGESVGRRVEGGVGGGDGDPDVGVPVVGRGQGAPGGDADVDFGGGVHDGVGVVEVGADPEEGAGVAAFVVPEGEVLLQPAPEVGSLVCELLASVCGECVDVGQAVQDECLVEGWCGEVESGLARAEPGDGWRRRGASRLAALTRALC